jgi:hypothetical protein
MLKSGKLVAGIGTAVLCLVLICTFALTAPAANIIPAQAAQATPTIADNTAPVKSETATPGATANPTKSGSTNAKVDQAGNNQYMVAFNQTFAAKLGVSEDALNSAFAAAVSNTAYHLLKDGKIDANQAAKLKAAAIKGPGSVLPLLPDKATAADKGAIANKAAGNSPFDNLKSLTPGALEAAAKQLNLSLDELNAKLQTGQSLADLAAAAKIDPQKIQDAMLASIKTQLDAAVKNGTITQTDADNILKKSGAFVGDMMRSNFGVKPDGGVYERLMGSDATWQALAQLLNLPVNSLKDQAKAGHSVLEIARTQQVDEAKIREGLFASMKSQLDSLVKDGTITQATADQAQKDIPNLVSKLIGGPDQTGK